MSCSNFSVIDEVLVGLTRPLLVHALISGYDISALTRNPNLCLCPVHILVKSCGSNINSSNDRINLKKKY